MEEPEFGFWSSSENSSEMNSNRWMNSAPSLFTLAWEDILFSHVFPYLNWKEVFHLGSVSTIGRLCVNKYFSSLKRIDVSNQNQLPSFNLVAFRKVTENCCRLKDLILRDCDWLEDDDMMKGIFTRNKHSLRHLDIGGCVHLTGKCLLPLAVHCKGLKVLILRECPWISRGALETLMAHVKALEEIDLSSCPGLNNQLIGSLVQRFPLLKRIRFAYVQSVNDAVLLCISYCCKENLTLLDIRSCMGVTDNGIRSVGEYCTSLKSLLISNCHLVTENSLKGIRDKGKITIDRDEPNYPQQYFIRMNV